MKRYEYEYSLCGNPKEKIFVIIEAVDSMTASSEFLKRFGDQLYGVYGLKLLTEVEQTKH